MKPAICGGYNMKVTKAMVTRGARALWYFDWGKWSTWEARPAEDRAMYRKWAAAVLRAVLKPLKTKRAGEVVARARETRRPAQTRVKERTR